MNVLIEAPEDYAADIAASLVDVGVTVGEEAAATIAQQQAAATMAMRVMRAIQRDIDTADEGLRLEKQALDQMAERQVAPLKSRLAAYRRYVETVAELMEWGKKKSHDSPYGTFGVRDKAAGVDCTDRAALATWAATVKPEFAEYEITLPLAQAREYFTETELVAMGADLDVKWSELKKTLDPSGDLPPGVVKVEAARTPFAKLP